MEMPPSIIKLTI
ncbi:hypothetical protein RDI58_013073 [Solanum bulbocastanum]